MKKDKIPNPGSAEAQEAGCTCPVLDNEFGEGMGGMFYQTKGCPLHWADEEEDDDNE